MFLLNINIIFIFLSLLFIIKFLNIKTYNKLNVKSITDILNIKFDVNNTENNFIYILQNLNIKSIIYKHRVKYISNSNEIIILDFYFDKKNLLIIGNGEDKLNDKFIKLNKIPIYSEFYFNNIKCNEYALEIYNNIKQQMFKILNKLNPQKIYCFGENLAGYLFIIASLDLEDFVDRSNLIIFNKNKYSSNHLCNLTFQKILNSRKIKIINI